MRLFATLPLLLASLAMPAHADSFDHFSVVGNGQDFEFSLSATSTGPDTNFSRQYSFGQVSGTLNGTAQNIYASIIFPTAQGVGADTFTVGTTGTYTELALPSMYDLSFTTTAPFVGTGTLTFLPGRYTSFVVAPTVAPYLTYSITVTPQGSAVTPEPPTFVLLMTATLITFVLTRTKRHQRPHAHP